MKTMNGIVDVMDLMGGKGRETVSGAGIEEQRMMNVARNTLSLYF